MTTVRIIKKAAGVKLAGGTYAIGAPGDLLDVSSSTTLFAAGLAQDASLPWPSSEPALTFVIRGSDGAICALLQNGNGQTSDGYSYFLVPVWTPDASA
jgi:hypothetical protein